jgi:LPS export ABC transporter protein LptC
MASVAPRFPHRPLLALLVGLGLLAAAASGCSGGKKVSGSGAAGELPDSEVEDFTVTETDSGLTQWTMFAKLASTYSAKDLVIARTLRVDFFGEDGKKSSQLVAREGELYQRTRDMVARGQVVLQTVEGWRMSTEELHFSNSRDKLLSDKLVRLEKEGSVLEGVGFESDPHLEHFEFRDRVRAIVQPGAARPSPTAPNPGGGPR